jgi:Zn finger protein HypA/HybF involved in hydrogenase expression
MSWHETTGPAVRPTPKCCRCGDSGRVWSCRQGDWVNCPDCEGDKKRLDGAIKPAANRVRTAND